MRGIEKNRMGRGHTNKQTDKRTLRLLERIGLRANSLKIVGPHQKNLIFFYGISATICIGSEIQCLPYAGPFFKHTTILRKKENTKYLIFVVVENLKNTENAMIPHCQYSDSSSSLLRQQWQ